ncbi:medium-chain acyl-CoA ligase ACSF2, mitochondrial-like [Periplaneta americana]|uniref:medium-chain acyl-CoA ligase ACSF2, mitochondrial-like n=1 Tax=Periplaneta americana TaxID=6978 RepID=UPI0037E88153
MTARSSKFKPSYYHCVGEEPLSALTVGQLMEITTEKWGDREAVVSVYQGHRYTFKEVLDKADRLAAALMQMGLKPGDRLGIWGPNSSEWYISRVAAARGGYIGVQIDPAYQAPELLHSLTKVEIKVIILTEFYKTHNCYEILRSLVPELDSCPESGVQIKCAKAPALTAVITMSDKQYRGAYRFNDVIASGRPESIQKIKELQTLIQPDDGCIIQFTSGTTGFPKASLASHHNLVNNAIASGKHMALHQGETRHIICPQFCHVTGSLGGILCGICYGGTIVLASPTFESRKVLAAIQQEKCTNIMGTPSLYVDLVATAKELGITLNTLKVASIGGAVCTEQLAQSMIDILGVERVCSLYGMTEIAIAIIGQDGDNLHQMTATVGRVTDHLEVKVVDEDGRIVPMGSRGELWVRGYSVTLGYWGDEKNTKEFIGPDGWAKTGDQFILQEDGYGLLVGRLKDMIIRIADNIFPVEIEQFFLGHPDILEVVVFGVPDPKVGEEICVCLRLKDGVNLKEKDIVDYCKDKVAEYRIPRYIRFVKEFQRTAMGKIIKHDLRNALIKELNL